MPYYVYILASRKNGTLYTGVTNKLHVRLHQHRLKMADGFTARYNVDQLIYFETTTDPYAAISREKQIKGWRRAKKVALIERMNPQWRDLFDDLLEGL